MVFSVLSLVTGLGLISTMPAELEFLHHIVHDYEIPMILTSGLIVLVGWMLHYIAYRMDCRATGCAHEPCGPKKKRSGKVLVIATGLFIINVGVYFFLHH